MRNIKILICFDSILIITHASLLISNLIFAQKMGIFGNSNDFYYFMVDPRDWLPKLMVNYSLILREDCPLFLMEYQLAHCFPLVN
jgi:hypothetical protein